MLYVFNSGLRPRYRSNLLVGLAAPPGTPYKVSYSQDRNVSDRALTGLDGLQSGEPALLVFIDRLAEGGYEFVPVRRARYVAHRLDAGRVEIDLQLTDWLGVDQGQDFNEWFTAAFDALGAPRKQEADEERDGDYAVVGPAPPEEMFANGDGWEATARALAARGAFQDEGNKHGVFARLDLIDNSNPSRILQWGEPAVSRPEAWYRKLIGRPARAIRFLGGRTYTARVTYYFPAQRTDRNAQVPYRLTLSGGLSAVSSLASDVNAEHRSDTFEFTAPPLGIGTCSVGLTFEDSNVIAPRMDVIGEYGWSPVLVTIGLGVGAAWIVGSGLAAQLASETNAFRIGYYIAPTLQWLAMILMFRYFGIRT